MNTNFIDFCERVFFIVCLSLFFLMIGLLLINKIHDGIIKNESKNFYFHEFNEVELKKINKIANK